MPTFIDCICCRCRRSAECCIAANGNFFIAPFENFADNHGDKEIADHNADDERNND